MTKYWFSIASSHLPGGLSRLAAFFHAPLFTESLTKREIYAVDSEHRRNVQNDARRAFMIDKMHGAHGHPYTMFQTGCVESITEAARKEVGLIGLRESRTEDKVDDEEAVWTKTRDRLVEWWKAQYCAGRMTLAVLGTGEYRTVIWIEGSHSQLNIESLDELTSMIVPLFSPIKNLGLDPRPVITTPVWGAEEQGVGCTPQYIPLYLTFHSRSYTSRQSRITLCFRSSLYSLTSYANSTRSRPVFWPIFLGTRAPEVFALTCGATAGSTIGL